MPQSLPNPQEVSEKHSQIGHEDPSKFRQMEKVLKIAPPPQEAVQVFIVDRDSMSSDLLASALSKDKQFECTALQPGELLHALETTEVDLVVIAVDANANPGSSFDLTKAVCLAQPNVYIVLLFGQTTHELVINAFRSGARGVFSRQHSMAEFIDCIQRVGRGFIWAGERETDSLLEAFKSIPAPNLLSKRDSPELTARELQVVQCAAKGKTNRAIASDLQLSEHTVKNYLFRAFEKLGVSNRVELLFYLTMRGHVLSSTKADCLGAGLGIK